MPFTIDELCELDTGDAFMEKVKETIETNGIFEAQHLEDLTEFDPRGCQLLIQTVVATVAAHSKQEEAQKLLSHLEGYSMAALLTTEHPADNLAQHVWQAAYMLANTINHAA